MINELFIYSFNKIIIYIYNELTIYIFKEIIIYIFNEIIILIQRNNYLYIQRKNYFHSTKWSLNIWSTKYKLGNWNLVFILYGFKRKANEKPYICPSAISTATKLGKVITCSRGTPPSKSHDLLIMWSREKLKTLISALPQYLWSSDLPGW